jgi:hypothetical protein
VTIAGTEVPQLVLVFAAAALALGAGVVLISVWRGLTLFMEASAARACVDGAAVSSYLERGTRFSDCLREIVGSDAATSSVSADAVALLGTDALEGVAQSQTDRLRYVSYTPLLAGLCGTVIGLMSLLRSDPDTMQQHLAGVLFGTLCGAGATLVASFAVSWLDGRVLVTKRAVTRLLFQKLLPAVPDKRIAVAIEETLLEIIDTRSRTLVEDISRLLTPLADSLGEHARQSTEAAVNASKAFDTAVHTVENAPVLADIVSQLTKASGNAQKASTRLATDAERLAALRESEDDAAKSIEAASQSLVGAVAQLVESTAAIRKGIVGEPPSLTATVQSIDADSKELSRFVSLVAKQVGNLNQELVGLSSELRHFGAGQVEMLGKRLEDHVRQLVEAVREQLEGAPGRTSDALQRVGTNAETLASRIRGATNSLEELESRSDALVAFVNARIQAVVTGPSPVPSNVNFVNTEYAGQSTAGATLADCVASLADSARTLRDLLNAIRAGQPPNPRSNALRRAWQRVRIRRRETD